MKTCKQCLAEKPFSDFHKRADAKDGYQYICKECNIAKVQKWQADNPERYRKNWRPPSKNPQRRARLYGITLSELEALLEAANGMCDICHNPPHRFLVIDHDHSTGKVRGILCEKCNQGLGLFKDDILRMKSAIEYLVDHVGIEPTSAR